MEKNQIIIIALIVVIVALLVGVVSMMPNFSKHDTNLSFESNSTLSEGDSVMVKLKDANGKALSNQTVNVTISDQNKASDYHSVVTDENGTGTLKIDKSAGNYTVTVIYGGNDNYSGCNASTQITIEEIVEEAAEPLESTISSSDSSSSSSDPNAIYYDSKYNIYYNGEGVIVDPDGHHGQSEGGNYYEVKEFFDSGKGME